MFIGRCVENTLQGQEQKQRDPLEAAAVIQVSRDDGVDQSGSSGSKVRWSGAGYIWKVNYQVASGYERFNLDILRLMCLLGMMNLVRKWLKI